LDGIERRFLARHRCQHRPNELKIPERWDALRGVLSASDASISQTRAVIASVDAGMVPLSGGGVVDFA